MAEKSLAGAKQPNKDRERPPIIFDSAMVANGRQAPTEIGAKLSNPASDFWPLFTEFDLYFSDGDVKPSDPEGGSSMLYPLEGLRIERAPKRRATNLSTGPSA